MSHAVGIYPCHVLMHVGSTDMAGYHAAGMLTMSDMRAASIGLDAPTSA